MSRQTFILFFIACNILIVFLHIHNHTNIVRELYRKQRYEKIKEELLQKKAAALRTLYILKNPSTIKQFATEQLNMQKITINQIKTVAFDGK